MAFVLDPRLLADTIFVRSLTMCELLIMNDARYPWAILVPRIEGAIELHDVRDPERTAIMSEMMAVSEAISNWAGVSKINIGALGNIVLQLHLHVIGRNSADPAWPGPVWGHSPRVPYGADEVDGLLESLNAIIK